jgi:hypothetical protein
VETNTLLISIEEKNGNSADIVCNALHMSSGTDYAEAGGPNQLPATGSWQTAS